MGKVQAEINMPFGKVIIEGSTPNDLLETLEQLPEDFFSVLETLISKRITVDRGDSEKAEDIVKYTDEGPVLMLRDPSSITHYEAIGLLLYFFKEKCCRQSQLRCLLRYSGLSVQVSSRLNEMFRKGLVFKPSSKESGWTLTPKGERWVKEEVLPRVIKMQ
ncbi:MAG: hypothetical protein QXR13_02885 [Candidatus Bathyarchaeia archaeon]